MDISKAKTLVTPRKDRKRVGRGAGSGHGKTAGRGHNGAKSRSGWSSHGQTGGNMQIWLKLPKRGFTNARFRTDYGIVNVGQLAVFEQGTVVTPQLLRERGMVKQAGDGVKILGDGALDRALTVRADAFSKTAVAKIEAAGGTIEIIPKPKPPVRHKMGAGRKSVKHG